MRRAGAAVTEHDSLRAAQVRTTHVETKSTEFGHRQAVLLAEKKEDSAFRWIRIVVRCALCRD